MTPMAEIEVSGTRRKVTLDASIDTGFDGHVCIPIDVGVTLGLELNGRTQVELADGSQKVELLFPGQATFLDKKQRVRMTLTDSEEALIGTELLTGCRLSVDFDSGDVQLK